MWLHWLHLVALATCGCIRCMWLRCLACRQLAWQHVGAFAACIGSMLYLNMRAPTWYVLPGFVCATDILEASVLTIKNSRYPAENLLSNVLGNVMHSLYCHPILYIFVSSLTCPEYFLKCICPYVLMLSTLIILNILFDVFMSNNFNMHINTWCCDTYFCISQCYQCWR